MALCFLLVPPKMTIKFHRRTRRVEYSRRRVFRCFSFSTSMNFDDVHGVEITESKCDLIYSTQPPYRIMLLTSQGQLVLETHGRRPFAAVKMREHKGMSRW
jgi:hypothetical protein